MYNPYNYASGINNMGVAPYVPTQSLQNLQQPTGLTKVTGIEGAKAYQMPPNSVTALFDSGEDIFYVKSTDAGGFGTITAYKFTPIQNEPKIEQMTSDFVSREEFEKFKEEVMNNGKQSVPKRANKDKSSDDE